MLCLNLIDEPRKRCTGCKRLHPVSYFCRTTATKDGYHTRCRACRGKKDREYYLANRERQLEKQKRYYEANTDAVLEYQRKRYQEDFVAESKARERARDGLSLWHEKRSANPVAVLADRLRNLIRGTLKKGKGLRQWSASWDKLGYSPVDVHRHLLPYLDKPCEECGVEFEGLPSAEVDHIVPICTAKTIDEIWELNRLSNLRLICPRCNRTQRRPR